jgi:formate hydrogenlyase subunit 4
MLGILVYCTLATVKPIPQAESSIFDYGRLLVSYVGGLAAIKVSWGIVGVLHPLEALYAFSVCRKHTSFVVGVSSFSSL